MGIGHAPEREIGHSLEGGAKWSPRAEDAVVREDHSALGDGLLCSGQADFPRAEVIANVGAENGEVGMVTDAGQIAGGRDENNCRSDGAQFGQVVEGGRGDCARGVEVGKDGNGSEVVRRKDRVAFGADNAGRALSDADAKKVAGGIESGAGGGGPFS